jgi:hypothetical protein
MAIRDDFAPGEVLAAADLNDTFGSKLDLAGGKILQIVRATDTTFRSTTSTSFTDASLSVTITPQKNDSAILLIAVGFIRASWTTEAVSHFGGLQLTDASNNAVSGAERTDFGLTRGTSGVDGRDWRGSYTLIGRVTPATTSAVTYKLRFNSSSANTTIFLQNTESSSQLFAFEVSA